MEKGGDLKGGYWAAGKTRYRANMTSSPTPLPSPGWFPDPERPGQLRWWDGQQWSEHRSSATVPPAADNVRNPMATASLVLGLVSMITNLLLIPGALAVVFGILGLSRSNTLVGPNGLPLGRTASIAGIALGVVGTVGTIALALFFWG